MRATTEDCFIKLFLSEYENNSWADADLLKLDAIDRTNPAVDQLANRKSDGRALAIEHTIIEPFLQEKEDFASFSGADFLSIEDDQSLLVPGLWIQVFVPVGILSNQPPEARSAIVEAVHDWLTDKRLSLPQGTSQHTCPINGPSAKTPSEIALTVLVTPLRHEDKARPGVFHVRRQQVEDTLGDVIQKALKKKLPKLISAQADRRILLLERQHDNFPPESILAEIESRRDSFADLAKVDEIWILSTTFCGPPVAHLSFALYENGHVKRSYDFKGGKLLARCENGSREWPRSPDRLT